MQERVAAELPLWDCPGIFVPEREIHVNNGLSDPDLAAERLEALRATKDEIAFAKMCLENIAGAGKFSSDRTIQQYAKEIWFI